MAKQRVTFTSDGLLLEGMLHLPDAARPCPGVVVCHPHPQYGGDMRNGIVEAIAAAVAQGSMAALTFNFRGVGDSQGQYDRGVGEAADALSALEFLTTQPEIDRNRLGIAGYSFGAGIALDAAAENHDVRAIVSVACPPAPLNDMVLHQINRPKLFIQGDADYLIEMEMFHFLMQRFAPPREIEVLTGADHSLRDHEAQVGNLAAGFFARHLI
ncbi:MAG: dienelactone hydrolase family protein [Chloroflexi bacterium]|nr:dienelactone hydrolase family protein [Chloroflexota bacterium]